MKKINFKIKYSLKQGFTLVETLVAVSIFSISILGLMSVLTQGIANSNYAKQKLIAAYLAQEGVEYIRNMRDTYVLYSSTSQTGWDNFSAKLLSGAARCDLPDGCYFGDLTAADFADETQPMIGLPVTLCSGACPELKFDSSTGKYGYATGVNSGFTRKIVFIFSSASQAKFSSTVSWNQGSGNHSITFSETLYNWVE